MQVFLILRLWLENTYSRAKIGVFDFLNGELCEKSPKRNILAQVRVV